MDLEYFVCKHMLLSVTMPCLDSLADQSTLYSDKVKKWLVLECSLSDCYLKL